MGGLGNQMFQYAFGKALENKIGKDVLFDNSWFRESKKYVVNDKGENSHGIVMRDYALNIFNLNISFANASEVANCKNKISEKEGFIYDKNLLENKESTYFTGYFQNENYFKDIKNKIYKEFTFPEIPKTDKYNQEWLNKIKKSENSVFIHIRRGDYLKIKGSTLSNNYYNKAVKYIKTRVKNPSFFVFCQNCYEYIKNEFNIDDSFEFIDGLNSENNEDWKDLIRMKECKHGIIANSTFSWWAAWLGKSNLEGIVIAPTPWLGKKDQIICENWVKIER